MKANRNIRKFGRISFILFILLLSLISAADETPHYGFVAGAIYPPLDEAEITGSVILTPLLKIEGDTALRKDENILPIYIRRMFKGRFFCDSIPAGFYEAVLNGVAYDSSFQVAARCVEQKLVNFRVAPDSVSLLFARLKRDYDDEFSSERLLWPEIIRPDTAETLAVRGIYDDRSYFEIYNDVILRKRGYLFKYKADYSKEGDVKALNLSIFSNRFYFGQDNNLDVSYNLENSDVVVKLMPSIRESSGADFTYRQPVFALFNIPISRQVQNIRFIAGDTAIYKVVANSLNFDIEEIQPGEVMLYREREYIPIEE